MYCVTFPRDTDSIFIALWLINSIVLLRHPPSGCSFSRDCSRSIHFSNLFRGADSWSIFLPTSGQILYSTVHKYIQGKKSKISPLPLQTAASLWIIIYLYMSCKTPNTVSYLISRINWKGQLSLVTSLPHSVLKDTGELSRFIWRHIIRKACWYQIGPLKAKEWRSW